MEEKRMNANKRISSGISIRESQVKNWLKERGFKGEYLLVSTKKGVRGQRSGVRGRLIVDLYTPLLLEKKVSFRWWNPLDWRVRQVARNNIKSYLLAADHFLVANRRQREYWLKTANDLSVHLKANDISVLPTGVGKLSVNGYRLTVIDRKVVLWFGGIYPWMDPRPLVETFGKLAPKFPDWKLRFLGGFHPDTGYKDIYRKVESLANEKISDYQLEFIPWQPEKNLNKYFADVALAVHLVKNTPEDYYAHRVRLLTLLEAGIPVITGGRDMISDLIDEIKAGMKVEGSVEDLTSKLEMVMSDSKIIAVWKLQTSMVLKLFSKREYIPINWRKIPGDRIKNCRKI